MPISKELLEVLSAIVAAIEVSASNFVGNETPSVNVTAASIAARAALTALTKASQLIPDDVGGA